jgi:antitoxin (DNA-binding transcriptional repressor) of toxin-antitoxin stability system
MRVVDLRVLKNKLSEYVRLAARGETVLVTDRDRVIAELVPPRADRSPLFADAMLADAVREGWLTPGPRVGTGPPPRKPIAAFRDLIEEFRRDRDARLSLSISRALGRLRSAERDRPER